MADRYWVGGSGNWDDPLKWSTTSGGAGGASVPTSPDDVYFDANSDTGSPFVVSMGLGIKTVRLFHASAVDKKLSLETYTTNNTGGIPRTFVVGSFLCPSPHLFETNISKLDVDPLSITSPELSLNNCYIDYIAIDSGSPLSVINLLSDVRCGSMSIYGSPTVNTNNFNIEVSESLELGNLNSGFYNFGSSTITMSPMSAAAINDQFFRHYGTNYTGSPILNLSGGYYLDWGGNTNPFKEINLKPVTSFAYFERYIGTTTTINNNLNVYAYQDDPDGSITTFYHDTSQSPIITNLNFIGTDYDKRINVELTGSYPTQVNNISNFNHLDIRYAWVYTTSPNQFSGIDNRYVDTSFEPPDNVNFIYSPRTVYLVASPNSSGEVWQLNNIWALSSGGSPNRENFPNNNDTVIIDDNSYDGDLFFDLGYLSCKNLYTQNRTKFWYSLSLGGGVYGGNIDLSGLSFVGSIGFDFIALHDAAGYLNTAVSPHYVNLNNMKIYNFKANLISDLHLQSDINAQGPSSSTSITVYNDFNLSPRTSNIINVYTNNYNILCESSLSFGTGTNAILGNSTIKGATNIGFYSVDYGTSTLITCPNIAIGSVSNSINSTAVSPLGSFELIVSPRTKFDGYRARVGEYPNKIRSIKIYCDPLNPVQTELFFSSVSAANTEKIDIDSFDIYNSSSPANFIVGANNQLFLSLKQPGTVNLDNITLRNIATNQKNKFYANNSIVQSDPDILQQQGPEIISASNASLNQTGLNISGLALSPITGAKLRQGSKFTMITYSNGTFSAPSPSQLYSSGIKFGTVNLDLTENFNGD